MKRERPFLKRSEEVDAMVEAEAEVQSILFKQITPVIEQTPFPFLI